MSLTVEQATTDVLVLGGGLSGYRAAIAARQTGVNVIMAYRAHGASPYVIGFNAPIGATDPLDTPQVFFDDMVRGGYGLNDRRLVRVLADQSIDAYRELAALGVPFAKLDGKVAQRHLSGNTYPRSVYIAEGTGGALLQALKASASESGIQTIGGQKVIGLLQDGGQIVGALLWKPHSAALLAVHARATVIAMGGIGRLYAGSTYPADVAADSLAMAFEAGARLIDMEFVQFEPVVTVWPEACRGMEMPTAMLGDGAQLLNARGERFMMRVNPPLGERGIEKAKMALHIQREIDEGRGLPQGGVLFDTRLIPPDRLESYVSHCSRLRSAGVDPAKQSPIVAPAAHSIMGGIAIDHHGASDVPGLFVGGEAAGGVHGASRVAGNGCADTLVFGALAGRGAVAGMLDERQRDWGRIVGDAVGALKAAHGKQASGAAELKGRIRNILATCAGIWRAEPSLRVGLAHLQLISDRLDRRTGADIAEVVELFEARRMALVARTIVKAALSRTESRGAHQRTDFPQSDDTNWLRHTSFRRGPSGEVIEEVIPIQ